MLVIDVIIAVVLPVVVLMNSSTRIFVVILRTHRQIAALVNSIGGDTGGLSDEASVTLVQSIYRWTHHKLQQTVFLLIHYQKGLQNNILRTEENLDGRTSFFSGKIQNGSQKHNFVYYSVIFEVDSFWKKRNRCVLSTCFADKTLGLHHIHFTVHF